MDIKKDELIENVLEKLKKIMKWFNIISIINATIYFLYMYIDTNVGASQIFSYIFNESIGQKIDQIYRFLINYCKIEIYICVIINIFYIIISKFIRLILKKNQLKNMLNTKNMQIYGEIYEYLSSKEKRPFLITGEWGSGKTYTINNFFEKFYKYNKQKIYKISCFGIDIRTTLISEMKNIFEKEDNSLTKKILDIINKIPIFGDFLSGLLKNDYEIKDIPENSIFIFDDFERIIPYGIKEMNANIEYQILSKYNIVIGVINDLIDRYNMKVFILCNTNEINNDFVHNVLEGKLNCKKFEIENDRKVFLNLTERALNSYTYFEEKEKISKFFQIISTKMEGYWESVPIENLRVLAGIISAFIELIKKYSWINESYYRDAFFTIYVYHILYYSNKLYTIEDIKCGQVISMYFKNKLEKGEIELDNPLFNIELCINKLAKWAGTELASFWINGKSFMPNWYFDKDEYIRFKKADQ